MLSTQPYKGARDFYPEGKRLHKYIFQTWRTSVERFGYEEYDASVIEPLEIYLAKTGEEIVNEQTYIFEDRGGRKVTLRPEMTPTVSRMVAGRRQELPYPLRWYSIPNLWRYERPQRGRLREHWQLNVDLFGIAGLEAEHEIVQVADAIMQSFGATRSMYVIKLNSRKLVDFILKDFFHLPEGLVHSIVKLIDRMHKMELVEFIVQLDAFFSPSEREAGISDQLLQLLKARNFEALPLTFRAHQSVVELEKLKNMLEQSGVVNVVFDISLMRGFDYYTDIVFEVFDTNPENSRSLFGGGRYDGLVSMFDVEPVPTIGFGMGDVTLADFLETHELMPQLHPETDAYVILIGDVYNRARKIVAELREMGLNVAVDFSGKKPALQLKTALKKNIRYAIFIGEQELESNLYVLRDLVAEQEERHGPERIVTIIKDRRRK